MENEKARRHLAPKDKMPQDKMPLGHFAPRHFAPNRTQFWKGNILPQLQNYGGHFGHILGLPQEYLRNISGIS